MKLHELPKDKSKKKRKRIARGHGCGTVKTGGRGSNGQKARSGGGIPAYFQGGGLNMFRRVPKLGGFTNINRKEYAAVNLDSLNTFDDGTEVTHEKLVEAGIIRKNDKLIKVLARGDLEKKLKIQAHAWSVAAEKKAKEAGSELIKID